jgi:hypothetical protein
MDSVNVFQTDGSLQQDVMDPEEAADRVPDAETADAVPHVIEWDEWLSRICRSDRASRTGA